MIRFLVAWCAVVAFAQADLAHAQVDPSGRGGAVGSRVLPASPADDDYQIGPEDVLQLQVWGRTDLSGTATVNAEGEILAPLLGTLRIGGQTPKQLTENLTERYQLLDPRITEVLVWVTEYNRLRLTMLGALEQPGVYGFREMPDLWSALLVAGGPTSDAELARVQLIRDDPAPGEPRTLRVDMSGGIERIDIERLPELRTKDTIVVPTADEVAAVGDDTFQIMGAVNSPGVYRAFTARTVLDAITVSGGATAEADLGSVHLLRNTDTGVVSFEIDLDRLLRRAEPLGNLRIQPGDTISVPEKSTFFSELGAGLRSVAPFISLAATIILANR